MQRQLLVEAKSDQSSFLQFAWLLFPPLAVTTKNFWKGCDHSRQKGVMNR